MNLSKIANLANVSVSTVSKAFSDSKEISKHTKEHIFKIAKDGGCFDKYYKPKYSKKLIAVICPEMLGIHYSSMATYLNNEINMQNGTMIMSVSNFSSNVQNELIDYYSRFANADGIIVIEPVGEIKCNNNIPIVQIGTGNESKFFDSINATANDALDEAIKYMLKKGKRNIGFIGENYTMQEYDYYLTALKRNNVFHNDKYDFISDKRFYDAGYYGMSSLLKSENIPDVVFAAYSHIAVGALQKLKEEGIIVPEKMSIICMDDIASVPYSDIEFSCIKMHLNEVCATALDMLYQKIEKKYVKAKRSIKITREFKIGNST